MKKVIYRIRFTHKINLNEYYLGVDDGYYGLGNKDISCIFKTVNEAQRFLENGFYIVHLLNNYYVDFELGLE